MRVRFPAWSARPRLLAVAASIVVLPGVLGAQEIDCNLPTDQEVRAVTFEGNYTLSADELSAIVLTTPSTFTRRYFGWMGAGSKRCLPDIGLGRDVNALKQFYQANGFYRTRVEPIVAQKGANRVRVTFKIDEGAPSIVDSLSIMGLEEVANRSDIVRDLQLRPGGRFGRRQLVADIDTITARLRNSGYPHASVLQNYDAGPNTPRPKVSLTVVPGERARFGAIVVQRVAPELAKEPEIDSAVVLRLLGFQSGNWYSDRAMIDGQRNLYSLGVFRHVGIDTLRTHGDTLADVIVDLREDLTRQISVEEGWGNLDCFRIDGQYTDKNFANRAWRMDLSGRVSKLGYGAPTLSPMTRRLCGPFLDKDSTGSSKLNYYAGATLRQPTLFRGHWIPVYSVYTERRGEWLAYLRTTYLGGDVSATRNLGDRMPLRVGYSVEYGETRAEPAFLCVLRSACDDAAQKNLARKLPFAVASVSFQRNRTDNVVEPRAGYTFSTEARTSARVLGSDTSLKFYKLTGDFALYRPVTSRITFATRFRGGFVGGGGTKLPPPQERLYAGGPESVRGFQQNQLGALIYLVDQSSFVEQQLAGDTVALVANEGARASRAIPVGGNTLGVINAELRIRDPFFPELLEYIPFVDAGELFTEGGTSVSNLRRLFVTPGIGVRYFSPVGPLQLNAGYNPARPRAGQAFWTPNRTDNSNKAPLLCVTSPGSPVVPVLKDKVTGAYSQLPGSECSESFVPFRSNNFFSGFNFTFSIVTSF